MDTPPANQETVPFDSWDDLNWDFIENNNGLSDSVYVNVEAQQLPSPANNPQDYEWNSDAGVFARITVQKPIRIARHADDMLPD
jgi:hypothetical protein